MLFTVSMSIQPMMLTTVSKHSSHHFQLATLSLLSCSAVQTDFKQTLSLWALRFSQHCCWVLKSSRKLYGQHGTMLQQTWILKIIFCWHCLKEQL